MLSQNIAERKGAENEKVSEKIHTHNSKQTKRNSTQVSRRVACRRSAVGCYALLRNATPRKASAHQLTPSGAGGAWGIRIHFLGSGAMYYAISEAGRRDQDPHTGMGWGWGGHHTVECSQSVRGRGGREEAWRGRRLRPAGTPRPAEWHTMKKSPGSAKPGPLGRMMQSLSLRTELKPPTKPKAPPSSRTAPEDSPRAYLPLKLDYPGLRRVHDQPPIYVCDDFLSHDECDRLIQVRAWGTSAQSPTKQRALPICRGQRGPRFTA